MSTALEQYPPLIKKKKRKFRIKLDRYKYLFLMMVPGLLFYVFFAYKPMYGILLAFKDYKFAKGIVGSEWVGLFHFEHIFRLPAFWQVFRNTVVLGFLKFMFGFPAPIIFALLLNEVRVIAFKKTVQTISFLPYFISWVVLSGLFLEFLSPTNGPLNHILYSITGERIFFLGNPKYFRGTMVVLALWRSLGWNTIVYLAAITNINPELYEAAHIDGAGRFQQVRFITLPSITNIIVILMVLNVGNIVTDDFDQIFNLYNPAVYSVGDVISTYVYRRGLQGAQFELATAVGLFQSVLAFFLLVITNQVSKRIGDYGVW